MEIPLWVAEIIWLTFTFGFIGIAGKMFWRDTDGLVSIDNIQLIIWTGAILGSYVGMAAMKGDFLGDIPTNLLALMGISGGSFVGATTIKKGLAKGQTLSKEAAAGGLFASDKNPEKQSLAKMQVFAWTLVTVLIFWIMVYNNFVNFANITTYLPDPGQGLVALMGISNGAYVGNKIPENRP